MECVFFGKNVTVKADICLSEILDKLTEKSVSHLFHANLTGLFQKNTDNFYSVDGMCLFICTQSPVRRQNTTSWLCFH